MLSSWLRKVARKSGNGKPRGARSPSFRPGLTVLEDRVLLSFFTAPTFAVGTTPVAQAVGDFNGDGHADLVVVNQGSNTVSVLPGNGDGTFRPKTDYAVGTTPLAVAVGDFNGDGKLDIVTANFGTNSVSVLLGNGDGTFRPKTDIALFTTPVSLAVGDFNGDVKLDLAVATEDLGNDYVNILRGNGDGTFQAPLSTITDFAPKGIALSLEQFSTIRAGDFNGDGRLDLVVVNNQDFRSARSGQFFSGGTVSVLLGNGDATFQAPQKFAVGTSPRTVAVGDFNGDGRLDFAVGNYVSGSVSVFLNTGGGAFSLSTLALAGLPYSLAAGDFNGTGRTELAVALASASLEFDLNILGVQAAGGGLQSVANYVSLAFTSLSSADVNGDGHLDLVGSLGFSSAESLLLNTGAGSFPAPNLINNPGVPFSAQATADFNGDGIPDRALASGQVELGLGDGNFGDVTTIIGGSGIAAADVDGNGTQDLLVTSTNFPAGRVAYLTNSPGYDNRTGGAIGFTVSAAQQVIAAGAILSVTVTAVDASGNAAPGFLGTVDLDASPAGSTALKLMGQYSFTAADGGRHTFLVSSLTQVGAYTLSTFAVAMPTVAVSVTVVPGALAKFVLAAPATIAAGTPFSFTITAEDTFGNVETGYTGTVHFGAMANDTQAVLPADDTFTAADAGMQTLGATLFKTAGPSSPFVSAMDLTSGIIDFATIFVTPLAPVRLGVDNLPSPYRAGTVVGVSVTALDVYGNRATSYTGTIHVSSSDARASLPADFTVTATNGGTSTFPVTLKSAGTQSFSVADTVKPAFASTQTGIVVVPGAVSVFVFSGLPASTTAGSAQTFTVTAQDSVGNVAPFLGTIAFSSTDSQASLPGFYTFTVADASSHTFTATLRTAGAQSLTATFSGSPLGTQSITVTPAAASSLLVTGFPTPTTAGVTHTFTVTAKDAFGNVATGYAGTVAFSSSDPIAGLPANYTFTATDAGLHTFTAALKRAGTQFLQATDTLAHSILGAENGIAVVAAAVTHFAFSGPATVTQGVGFSFTVSAVDDFGNVNTGYRGAVHLSSTDPKAGTQNFTFSNNDNGVHVFSYTFNTLGLETLTIVDLANSVIASNFIFNVVPK